MYDRSDLITNTTSITSYVQLAMNGIMASGTMILETLL